MARIPTLEIQISNMKSLLRTMCDRVHAGLLVVEQHLHVPNTEALIKVVALDSEVDRMEQELDDAVLQIFATQQPRAQELRLVYATAKIAHHVERMGDAVESLARQLATADLSESRSLLLDMITHVKDLFARSYAAMFEEDHSGIQEIFDLDDAVDECQRAIVQIAKDMFLAAPRDPDAVERGLKLITIASKLEKIADLCCNWAVQSDFAAHGSARRVLKKRKLRVVLTDDFGGQVASLCAHMLAKDLSDALDLTVAATEIESSKSGVAPLESLYSGNNIGFETAREFPIVRFEQVSWSRCFLLVNLGRPLQSLERDLIPHKTMVLEWQVPRSSSQGFGEELRRKLSGLASILARSDVSSDKMI
jgi:phosphate transport system protein